MQDLLLESVSAESNRAVLRATGELDVYTAPKLRDKVIELLDEGALHLIVDLRGVEFLDSTGLGALVGSLNRLRTCKGSLHLAIDSDRIIRIFRITGLVSVFTIHPTVSDAIAADQRWRQVIEEGGHDIVKWCQDHGLL